LIKGFMQYPPSFILMFLVFPVWVAAGFADCLCHRRTGIAQTSGLKENLLHLVMFVEISLGMLAVALLEINAAVLLCVFVVFVVHQLTVYWDLRYSTLLRDVGPFEQMVHSFLELLPLLSLCLLAAMTWADRVLAGAGDVPADWSLRMKQEPWPDGYLLAALVLVVVFNLIPLLQETWACARARPKRKPTPQPKIEPQLEPQTGANPQAATARTPPNPGPR
jgi:hypothetical protein